jgi:hypothetical protein
VKVTLALENSRALSDQLVLERMGAKDFVNALPDGMEVTIVSTAPVPRVVKTTTDRAAMIKAIDAVTPDSSSGRFLEAYMDWVKRVDKDKNKGAYMPVLVLVGSTYGEELVNLKDLNAAMDRLPTLGATVYSLLMSAKTLHGSAADAQFTVGQDSARMTNGKFEEVFNVQRIQAALGELGAQVAKLQTGGGGAYVVTVQRAGGAPAQMGPLSLSAPEGVTIGQIRFRASGQ